MLLEKRQPGPGDIHVNVPPVKGRDVRNRLQRAGRTQAELARHLSARLGRAVSAKSVSRLVLENRRIGVEEAAAIDAFFGEEGQGFFPLAAERGPPNARAKVPLYGLAGGAGFDAIAYSSDSVLEWIDAPLLNVDAAFRVAGASMEPRLFAGETVFVKLGVGPARGQDCVVELKDETQGVIVKTFQQQREGWVFLRQWNPENEIKLRWDQVRGLHAVRARA